MDSTILYEKVLFEHLEKGYQYKLTLSLFRDVEYLHIRKYFLSYDGEFMPTKEGAAIPATLQNTYALLDGLIELCSKAEGVDSIETHFANKITDLKKSSE